VLVLLAVCVSAFATSAVEQSFQEWMTQWDRTYTNDEYQKRLSIYAQNMDIIEKLNMNNFNVTYGQNNFTDWTPQEFRRLLGYKKLSTRDISPLENVPLDSAPSAFDWCSRGVCTAVKDQAQCGSCWAFATTENIESVNAIAGRGLPTLAPQQIVDCDTGELGCSGGDPAQAYEYVVRQGGLDNENCYPYKAVRGACRYNSGCVGARIAGERNGYGGSEAQMAANLAATAPFSIIVDASSWQNYRGGILPSAQCGKSLDHAVVAVGYDIPAGYWRVRNSWGAGWGENGFIRLQYNANTCGIQTEVLTAVI